MCHLEAQLCCILEPVKNVLFWFMENKSECGGPCLGSVMSSETGIQTGTCNRQERSPRSWELKQMGFFEAVSCQSTFQGFPSLSPQALTTG